MGRPYTKVSKYATYRVKVTPYANGRAGRKRTMLVPANSNQEAENFVRKRVPSQGGYHFDTKRVADHWRERD